MLGVQDAKPGRPGAGRIICVVFLKMLLHIAGLVQMRMPLQQRLPLMFRPRQMAFSHWDILAEFAHCLRWNKLVVVRRRAACAESLVPLHLEWQQLYQQILGEHAQAFAAAAVPLVVAEAAASLAGMEQLAHVAWCPLAARSVSMGVVLELVAAVAPERKLATKASEEAEVADTGFSSELQQHFVLAS